MNGRDLFERARALWPEPVPHTGNKLQALNDVYWPLDKRLGCEDEWLSLAIWAFHQSIWEHAKSVAVADSLILSPAEVPFSIFDRFMRMNLQNESWSNERAEYVSDLP